MPRIRVIHWKPSEAVSLLEACTAAGHIPEIDPAGDAQAIGRAIKSNPPDAIAIDLTRLPSHGREFAVWLRGAKATRKIPLVFIDGDSSKVEAIRALLPDAIYTSQSGMAQAIRTALSHAPEQPVVPPQMDERFADKTTAQKLGIKSGVTVAIVGDPPANITVDELRDAPAFNPKKPAAVSLWFIEDEETLVSGLPHMRTVATKTKLWIAWRKGKKTTVNENLIRGLAIEAGLVDYKICSVDACWSAMAFAARKPE